MTPLDTVKENLSLLHKDMMHVSEKTLYELSELSEILYKRMGYDLHTETAEMLLHRGSVAPFLFSTLQDEIPAAYKHILKEKETFTHAVYVCAFSLFLSEKIRKGGKNALPWKEQGRARARIVYVPSSKADEAYFTLAALRREASVVYAESTQDAINILLSREADFAMLPYLSANGERVRGVDRLCAQNDLYLCARISFPEKEDTLVYALFSTQIAPYIQTDTMALSLQITADSYAHLGRILSAIPAFGYEQASLFTEAEEYGRVRACAELFGEGDALALWLYLSLYSAGSTLLGRYPVIETKER